MSKIRQLLLVEYANAYDLGFKKKYSEPKIYDAGGDLSKRWYVYFSFRNPQNDKLERQTPIYQGVNQYTELSTRKKAIKILRDSVSAILKNGYNPYIDEPNRVDEVQLMNIPDAVQFVLKLKKSKLSANSYQDFRIRITAFEKWLLKNGFENRYVTSINKKSVITYLNEILVKTSARNRNNTRSNISMFLKELEDNEIINDNFVGKINVLPTNPERNKTYTVDQEIEINKLAQKDKIMMLFIQFISYNYLRPVEVVRLKIKNLNIKDRLLYVKTKTGAYKIKIIPEILLEEIPDLREFSPDAFLFTPHGFGMNWDADETSRRHSFGKRFKEIKMELNLGKDYGMYSFRHTYITKLYRELVKGSTPFEAKSKLMLITGHSSMSALEKYLRDIDAELPEDYSAFIK